MLSNYNDLTYLSMISGVECVRGVRLVFLEGLESVVLLSHGRVVRLQTESSLQSLAGRSNVSSSNAALGNPEIVKKYCSQFKSQ